MGKTTQPVQRLYQNLDAIADARRHSDVQRRRHELDVTERSLNAMPINPSGWQTAQHMNSQIAQQLADRREALRVVEALEGDELCLAYAMDIIGQAPGPDRAESLGRGAVPSSFAPGMNQAR